MLENEMTEELEKAVYHTVRYHDLVKQAVTLVQIWRCLIRPPEVDPQQWQLSRGFSLKEVEDVLKRSDWLGQRLSQRHGFYVLKGHESYIKETQRRYTEAQMKWKQARKLIRRLLWVPGARMLAVSGSLAAGNTHARSDIDILVIAARGRIWLVRLGMLLAAQLTGRRRKYWHKDAPGKLCLNHYLSEGALKINPEIRNIYTAVQYQNLVYVAGENMLVDFWCENQAWIGRLIRRADFLQPFQTVLAVAPSWWSTRVRRLGEWLISGSRGETWELRARRWQQSAMGRHVTEEPIGRVNLSSEELAFHPGRKAEEVISAFNYSQD